jgi:hypothetical protein
LKKALKLRLDTHIYIEKKESFQLREEAIFFFIKEKKNKLRFTNFII